MHKQVRRPILSSRTPPKRVLQLSLETVRRLSSEELSHVVAGCPTGTGSSTTTLHGNGSDAVCS